MKLSRASAHINKWWEEAACEDATFFNGRWFLAYWDGEGTREYTIWHICRPDEITEIEVLDHIDFLFDGSTKCRTCKIEAPKLMKNLRRLLNVKGL